MKIALSSPKMNLRAILFRIIDIRVFVNYHDELVLTTGMRKFQHNRIPICAPKIIIRSHPAIALLIHKI